MIRNNTSLARTDLYSQNSRKSAKSGSSVRRKKRTRARLKRSDNVLRMEVASHRLTPTNPKVRIISLDLAVLSCLPLDMHQLAVKSQLNTLAASTRCTRPRVTAKCTQGTLIRPMARVNKCKMGILSCGHKSSADNSSLAINAAHGNAPKD